MFSVSQCFSYRICAFVSFEPLPVVKTYLRERDNSLVCTLEQLVYACNHRAVLLKTGELPAG